MAGFDFVRPQGVFVPDTSDLLAEVEGEYKTAFGTDLAVTPDTPQGMLIAAETVARAGTLSNVSAIANQINPNVAEGVFLDSIWAMTGGKRVAATKTIVDGVLLNGVPSAIIPSGSIARTTDTQEDFELLSSVVLDNTGNGTGSFQAVNVGQIACNVGMLTQIVSGAIGWLSVTNPSQQSILGSNLESDEQSRARRRLTLALQAVSTSEAIVSVLNDIDGVKSVAYRENVTNIPAVIDGINLVPHSMWACVDGGTDDEVASAILSKKSIGCGMNGTELVSVVDKFSGQAYEIKFDRPTEIGVSVRVTIRTQGAVSDPVSIVKKAIMDYQAGLLISESGLTIGMPVSAFELSGAINSVSPMIFVQSCEVAQNPPSVWVSMLSIALNEKAVVSESGIAVTLL